MHDHAHSVLPLVRCFLRPIQCFLMPFAVGLVGWWANPALSAQVEEAWTVQQAVPAATGHEIGALTTDSIGNLYVAAHSYFPTSKWDWVLTKYSPPGAPLWQTRFVAGLDNDFASAIAVQAAGVFIAGSSRNENGHNDFLTVKYSTTGTMEWARRYNGAAGNSDNAVAVAVVADAAGNVIAGGNSAGPTRASDFAVVKYDSAGNQLWTFRYDGPGQGADILVGMKMDAQGNIYLAGTSSDVGGVSAIVTLKLDSDGQQLWAARFLPTSDAWQTVARSLALDGAGNVITVGDVDSDFITLKYGPEGGLVWLARYHAEEPADVSTVDVRVDRSNNVVTAGNLYGSGINDAVLVKYDANGQQLWTTRIIHPLHPFHLSAIAMDAEDNTYLTGTPYNDALTVKVAADGNQLWRVDYNSSDLLYDYGEAITVDGAGNVFIAGRTLYVTERYVSIVKYRQTALAGAPRVSVT